MRVERIELIGFKSFADKTAFKFHPGITSIVGPNGCGKSNIVDAFKWVLGEQSAKSLRGDSMEDVIFAGSATKKTKGMAEVTLVLSDIIKKTTNGDGDKEKLTQISVTRRLYRSGESEYLMNKVPCRLKDIKNMFLDTGLELKAYSILEQGKIGDIINSKPYERRFLIEEVAGVMKYKVRKHEAVNKLESSKGNLQRLQDIIAEVKRQINTIDRHAKKAERYKRLFEEIKDVEIRIGKRDFISLQGEISHLSRDEERIKSREAEVSANVHSLDAVIEEKKRLCIEQEKSLNEIRTRLYTLDKEATEEEGRINLLKSDCENLRERLTILDNQGVELNEEKDQTSKSLTKIEESKIEMSRELSELEQILDERNTSFSHIESDIYSSENNLEQQRKTLFSKAEEISKIRNNINHINLNLESLSQKTDKSSKDIDALNDSLNSLHLAIEETKDERLKVEAELQETRNSREDIIARLQQKKIELGKTEESLYKEREELAAMSSKLESMEELDNSNKRSLDDSIKILCQVADAFEAPTEYEVAIEAILGDKLRADVVTDQSELTKAIQSIREKSEKRSGFIAVNAKSDGIALSSSNVLQDISSQESGIVGAATDFVSAKSGFEQVVGAILQDVVLVDSLKKALSLREKFEIRNTRSPYFVSLDGDVLEPSGMVFGGSDKGVLKIKRMIKELRATILTKKEFISRTENTVKLIKEDIVSLENKVISLDGIISSKEKYTHGLKVKIENLDEEDERLNKKHKFITLEISDDQKEKDNLKSMLGDRERQCEHRENEKKQIEQQISSIQQEISDKKELRETRRSELTEVKLNLASSTEKLASITKEIERLNARLLEIARKKNDTLQEHEHIEKSIDDREKSIVEKDDSLKSKVVLIGNMQAEAAQKNEVLEAKTAELALVERQAKELSSELETIRSELSSHEMQKMEKSMKLNYLKDDIYKTYSLEIETVDFTDTVTNEQEEKLPQLKEKLKSIGPVSLGTLDEYEELKSRFEFLSKQRDDLLESIGALEDTIRKINKTTQKRLSEAFEALNEKFKEVFMMLFGKGRAELQLTEGSILDAGIEIIAQPPGKRLQNMMLLSGGEKALTALALLFAGFMIKPTPMCLLDEVDAPLDESNTDRFIKLLSELATNIQFITITHNRRTMEAADYLYGITMEEPGASKVVSMHLAEAV